MWYGISPVTIDPLCVCVCAVCIVIDNEIYNNLIFATTPCSCVCKHGFSSSAFFRILFSSAKLPPSGTWWAGFYLLYHLCDSLHISHIHRLRSSLKFYPEVFVSVYSFTTTINVKLVKWDNAQQTKTLKMRDTPNASTDTNTKIRIRLRCLSSLSLGNFLVQ